MEGLNLIAHNDLKNPATEAYRVIRTSIQFAQAGKELKTLAVTSCMPNEGKSMEVLKKKSSTHSIRKFGYHRYC